MELEIVDSDWLRSVYDFERPQVKHIFHRACEECRRKKTRCDMSRPSCSLCHRTRAACNYPIGRRSVRRSRTSTAPKQPNATQQTQKPAEASSGSPWDAFFDFQATPGVQLDPTGYQGEQSLHPLWETSNDVAVSPTLPNVLADDVSLAGSGSKPSQDRRSAPSPPLLVAATGLDDDNFGHESFSMLSVPITQQPELESPTQDCPHPTAAGRQTQGSPSKMLLQGLSAEQSSLPFSTPFAGDVDLCPSILQEFQEQTAMPSLPGPENLVTELLQLFFDRVQMFLPLLHRPNFEAEFPHPTDSTQRYDHLNLETALLLNGMCALSARFSTNSTWTIQPRKRGQQFADRARQIYDLCMRSQQVKPSLRVLQGYILLVFHDLTSKPSFEAWINTGICCRIAYSLSLHLIDRGSSKDEDAGGDSWVEKEEKRRVWWVIYQMDNFASIIAARPFNIDSSRMHVLLPVSDSAWFSNNRASSAPMSAHDELWRSLVDCENQDPYAWYLVCNGLLRGAHQEFDKRERSVQDIKILRSALHCFGLGLPATFRSFQGSFLIDDQNFSDKNWAICTLILLQAAHIFAAIMLEQAYGDLDSSSEQNQDLESLFGPNRSPTTFLSPDKLASICRPHINEHLRGVMLWPPDAIFLANPLVACALIGPAAVHTTDSFSDNDRSGVTTLRSMEWQILDLALSRFAEYWDLGQFMQDVLRRLIGPPLKSPSTKKQDTTWIQGLMPDILQTTVR